MASMRDIKRRKVSIQSTQQITKAMKLVSTVKLQRAKNRADRSKAYFECMYKTVCSMLMRSGNINHPYLVKGSSDRKAVIVITSNRGLAGGFNSNIVKLITKGELKKEELDIYAVGHKGRDALNRYGYTIKADGSDIVEEPVYADAQALAMKVLASYKAGEIGEIYLAYTAFKNTVVHIPTLIKLLPVDREAAAADNEDSKVLMNYEPAEDEALEMIIPKYVTSLIYGALVESVASENGARMQAMDSATSNAEEMISHLELQYNRARQGSITQELTEIIAGAEAIS
ncbi:ATP synthase F1 subunit gamma [bacterium C-53]|nr:ATP synthase F1 subunit gamma [Lachnospiraceae bacterium]NBI04295.1 ATP synthase F1 subunit gamma [Lachnospiraceae bacterium]RKJ08465.1 ATP synthase F1 subunit gamma [bacterium C-53]